MSTVTPEQLFLRFLEQGDERALDALFRRCSPGLRGFAIGLGVPRDRVCDLVHETLVTAVQRGADFDASQPLLPWLKGILARKAASLARDEGRRRRHQDAWARQRDANARGPIEEVASGELLALLRESIAAVPEKYRAALELHLLHGLPPAEVARRLGRLQTTVRVHLHRGIRQLRRRLPEGLFPLLMVALPLRTADAAPRHLRSRVVHRTTRAAALAGGLSLAAATWLWSAAPETAPPVSVGHVAALRTPADNPSPQNGSVPNQRTQVIGSGTPTAATSPDFVVHVFDADTRPLPHVGLCIEPAAGIDPLLGRRHVVTDAQGEASLGHLPWTRVRVRSDRGHDECASVTAGRLDLHCASAPRLTGIVTDAAGRPVPDVAVWLADATFGPGTGGIVTVSGRDGTFVLEHVPPGALIAAFGSAGLSPLQSWSGTTAPITLQLAAGGCVRGEVRDAAHRPIANATVTAGAAPEHEEEGFPDAAAWFAVPTQAIGTDADGRFGPIWLPTGAQSLHVRAAGHVPAVCTVDVSPRTAQTPTIELAAANARHGSVLSADGEPIAAAQIVFRDSHRNHRIDLRSDGSGGFDLDLPPADDGALCIRADGFRPQRLQALETTTGDLVVHLDRDDALRGQLLFADQRPAAHYTLRWTAPPDSALDLPAVLAHADATGHFDLDAAPAGDARCCIRGPGDPVWHPFSGGVRTGCEWRGTVPESLQPSAHLLGSCRGCGDRPVARGRVYLSCDGGTYWEAARTGENGEFVAGPLAPGQYAVFVESQQPEQPCLSTNGITLLARATHSVAMRSGPAGKVTFELAFPDGGEPDGVMLTIVGGTPPRRYLAHLGARGTQVLPSGDYQLYAMGEHFTWIDGHPFHIDADGETSVRLAVEPAVRTNVALQWPAPPARQAWTARLVRATDGRSFGAFHLLPDAMPSLCAWLPPGAFALEVRNDAGETWSGELTVADLRPHHTASPVMLRSSPR